MTVTYTRTNSTPRLNTTEKFHSTGPRDNIVQNIFALITILFKKYIVCNLHTLLNLMQRDPCSLSECSQLLVYSKNIFIIKTNDLAYYSEL